jgi:glycosyltransferase involved in cell wall biosynthesis
LLLQAERESFDAVIVNDVHALQVVSDLFPADRIWADMHEYAPLEGEHDWRWRFLYRRHIKFLCQVNLSKPKVVTSVGQAICDRYTHELMRPVLLLRNSSPYSPRLREVPDSLHNAKRLNLVHVGVSIRARKLENMIDAARGRDDIHLTLFLLPTEASYHTQLVEICSQLPNVEIREPIPVSLIVSEISKFDAGIVTIPPTSFNYANGLPNKLFQYLQARLPIVTGPIPEIGRIVEQEGVGVVSEGFDSESIFAAIQKVQQLGVGFFSEQLDRAAIAYSIDQENIIRRETLEKLLLGDR